jgi:hypothetical protein
MTKINLTMLGPCGIYCGTCDIHLAGKTGDREAQKHIADWITENFGLPCDPEKVRCGGCWGPTGEHWSADCKVLQCAASRGHKLCVNCEEYPDCETLEGFYRSGDYESARRTLERIREIGLDAWVMEREAGEE